MYGIQVSKTIFVEGSADFELLKRKSKGMF